MSDQNTTVPSLFLREEELRRGLDLIFFASRDMRAALDEHLQTHDLGHAHYRALYFILRRPGMSVGDLLATLKITNQSANRVLNQLLDKNLIESRVDETDRRKRRLFTTDAGTELTETLEKQQLEIMAKAYRKAGPQAVGGFWAVLDALSQD